MKRTVFLIILFSFSLFIYGQNSQNEGRIVPISQKIQNQTWLNRVTDLDFSYSILKSNFNWQSIKQEDSIRELQKLPRRIGLSLPIDLNLLNDIAPIDEDGYYIYRCKIYAEDAKKVGFVFDDFYLQPGDEIYIANENGQVIGPITEAENKASRMYSTIPINGQEITLIYVKQQNSLALSRLHLSEIVYIYYEEKAEKDLGDADDCQVNINCSPEGDNWQVQKRGVARIYFREGSSWYLCSGTLINNTANDGTPYFLTAYHCGGDATAADRNVWQFYFNYERPGCPNTGTPPNNVITGCTYKAGGDMNGGSDFQLLLLSSAPSLSWNPYYNGWSRSTTASPSGVSIHHPSGDAKKISTYTQTLGTGTWSGGMSSAHWTVRWAQTANGWGVTEGGSSGSPIFDNNKRIVGTLTGGSSTCNNPTYQDYYGKFSKHWDANGTTNDKKLQPWLDPLGTNPTTLDGYDPNNPSGVNNPQNFVATSISQTQIDLSWSLNSSNNPVLLVYNTTNTFGTPTNGTNYNVGQTIPGGGTVIYKGTNTSFAHTGLNAGTTYYYKIFSIATGNNYSSGLTAQATTWWQGAGFSLDFEACADWSTDFTPWTSYDGDGKDTYGSSDCNFTGEGTAFGFMAFNPSLAGCFDTHGGQRCGISICPADGTESNDWIISPQIQMNNNGSISFWVKSPKPGTWGEETYDVLVSTTNNQPSSFTAIATDEIAPASWTQKTYSLSAYNNQTIYVAIRHRATDKFMMMIDDIVIDTGTVSPTNPSNFTATSISQTQIDLSWSLNSSNNPVLLVYNTTNTFGTPTNGTNYNVGQTIPGGGTVIYKGTNTSFAHTGLNAGTTYYYKIFSIATGNNYSSGLTAQATTWWQGAGFSLDFEACADWSTDFTPWTSYDGDGKTTYQSADCDFTGEGTAFGFMAFNPSLAGCFDTHGGERCGVSICPADGTESDDWIISPQIQMNNNGSISFWVKSPKPGTWGEETYDVLVSTTNNQPSSFTAIATDEIAPASWTQKTYSLSAYNNQTIYVAIRHRATDKFMMMIDDIVIDTGTVSPTNPVASFTYSPSNICQGAQVQFTNTSQNATSYSWSFPGGNPSTSTQTNPVVTFNTAGNINVTLIAFNGTISDTIIQSITVNPLPIVSASANPSSICVGDSSIFSATGANTYNWSNGMSGSQITVSPATSSTYTVTGTNLNGCTNTATVSITVNASPTININANPQSICIGSSTIISASGATTYSWSNGMSGSQITVSPTNTTTYTVTGTNTFNCSNTATINITVETMPSAGTISASDNQLCQNELLTLTLNDYSPNSNIQWQISTDGISWNDIVGATSSNYNYTFTSAGIYNFRAKVSNSCTSVYSDPIIITVNPLPTPGTASADTTTICQNNPVLLTLSGYSSGTTIQWQISNDNLSWNDISGANSAVYNYTPTNAGTIYIRAQVTNNCGSASSNSIFINVEAIPNGGNINASFNTICQNDNVALILTGQTPMTSLQWQLSTDNITWFNISGANASNYNFIANNLGTYYFRVIVSNNCGTATSNVVNLTVNPIPPTPTISLISSYPPILYSNATTGNQWYNLNGAIQGATNQTYQVIENGTYYVIVTENNCQSLPSDVITINNVSIESYDNNDVIVYPIPASDMIYIQTNHTILEAILYDNLGRLIIRTNEQQLNLENATNGVYYLIIKLQDKVINLPVMIKK